MSARSFALRCFVIILTVPLMETFVVDQQSTDPELLRLMLHLESEVNILKEEVGSLKAQLANQTGNAATGQVPAFLATLDATVSNCNGRPVIFDNVRLNEGSFYDIRHGLFRAPINGTYHFAVTLSNPGMKTYHVVLVKNNPVNQIGYLHLNPTDIWTERSTTVLVKLQKGDDVWLECVASSTSYIQGGGFHSHFSGFFVEIKSIYLYPPEMACIGGPDQCAWTAQADLVDTSRRCQTHSSYNN